MVSTKSKLSGDVPEHSFTSALWKKNVTKNSGGIIFIRVVIFQVAGL